jgi:N-formylglutamate amidohydrolase
MNREMAVPGGRAVVIHVPHAATHIPDEVWGRFLLSEADLHAELERITDHFPDELFEVAAHLATPIRFPVSRLVLVHGLKWDFLSVQPLTH